MKDNGSGAQKEHSTLLLYKPVYGSIRAECASKLLNFFTSCGFGRVLAMIIPEYSQILLQN